MSQEGKRRKREEDKNEKIRCTLRKSPTSNLEITNQAKP